MRAPTTFLPPLDIKMVKRAYVLRFFESDLRHSRTNGQVVYFSDLPVVIEVFAFCLSRMSRTALHVAHTLSHK